MNKALSKQKTNKLFYGKWPYKISTEIEGGHLIRRRGIDWIANYDSAKTQVPAYYRKIDFTELRTFAKLLEPFLGDKVKIRVYTGGVDIYLQDKAVYEELQKLFYKYIKEIFEPVNANELEAMLTNNKIILRNA